jgi:hypothetical protein
MWAFVIRMVLIYYRKSSFFSCRNQISFNFEWVAEYLRRRFHSFTVSAEETPYRILYMDGMHNIIAAYIFAKKTDTVINNECCTCRPLCARYGKICADSELYFFVSNLESRTRMLLFIGSSPSACAVYCQ